MGKKLITLVRAAAVPAVLLLGILCVVWAFCGLGQEQGAKALLLAVGFRAEEASAQSMPAGKKERKEMQEIHSQVEVGETLLSLPNDGIVPFHADELPGAEATPEPGRDWNTVKEIFLDGGSPVAGFFVKDTSGAGLDLEEELLQPPAVNLKLDGSVEVLIYHTHTSEAYVDKGADFYYTDMETRTQNQNRNVTAVGEEIRKALEAEGIGVVHDTTVNDELYNGSYSRSWEVLQKNLEKYPGIQVTIDVHRDSMTTEDGLKYKPTVAVNGRKAAQIMFLAGSDVDGEWGDFPNWRDNLHLALRVQQAAEALYPGLARPLDFSYCKYNMNDTKGSMLVEVGTDVNAVSEAKYSGRLVGEILAKVLKENGDGEQVTSGTEVPKIS